MPTTQTPIPAPTERPSIDLSTFKKMLLQIGQEGANMNSELDNMLPEMLQIFSKYPIVNWKISSVERSPTTKQIRWFFMSLHFENCKSLTLWTYVENGICTIRVTGRNEPKALEHLWESHNWVILRNFDFENEPYAGKYTELLDKAVEFALRDDASNGGAAQTHRTQDNTAKTVGERLSQ